MTARFLQNVINQDIGAINVALIGTASISIIAVLNVVSGYDLSITPFYMILALFVSWHGGLMLGFLSVLAILIVLILVGMISGHPYSHDIYFYVNSFGTASCFLPLVLVTSRLRRALERERMLARTDPLTRIANRARFEDVLSYELASLQRYRRPFAVASIDCDDFQAINDRLGRTTGDDVLRAIAETLQSTVRSSDLAARIGGDQFALLLPEISPVESLRAAERIRRRLLAAMQARDWPVTFSIGLAVFQRAPESAADTIAKAAALMDRVKQGGKDRILQETY